MAYCVECDEEYSDERAHHADLEPLARAHCVVCWDRRVPMRAVKSDYSKRLILDHKSGYKLVRNREDCQVYSTGKPNVRTF